MIKRAHIRQFLALVDEGSFTQAAHRLGVTQPTLSTGIAELERLSAAPLFIRDRRKLRLTEAGGRFLPIARDVERGFRAADGFCEKPNHDWPQLKLGVIPSFSSHLLQLLMKKLMPRFSIELIEGTDAELRSALSMGRIQMALTILRVDDKEEGVVPLYKESYAMLAGKHHPLAGQFNIMPEDLAAEIMIARRSCELLETTSRFFAQKGVRPRFALRSHDDERCLAMVATGLGITTAPISLAWPDMTVLQVDGYNFSRRLGFISDPVWIDQSGADFAVQAAANHISDHFQRFASAF